MGDGWTPPTASMCQDGGVDQPSERRRPCRRLPRLVWISQSRFFMRTARMRRARWCSAAASRSRRCRAPPPISRWISSMSALDRKLARISSLLKRAWPSAVANSIQIWPMSRSRSVNHGTDTSNFLPPAMRSNSIARSSPPRSSSWPTTPESPRSAASTA
jgi:hypothetical protein